MAARAVWVGFALVALGAFLPWAEVDMEKAAAEADGPGAFGAMILSRLQPVVDLDAWNTRAEIGTARLPVWLVLAAAAVAALAAQARRGGVRAVPYAVAPILAAAAAVLVVTWSFQCPEGTKYYAGFWLTLVGAVVLAAGALRDPLPLQPGDRFIHT